MRFAFRVDSSPKIGMGHIMRCLTLANGLRKSGFECYFICRDFAGNGVRHVKDSGFQLELLSNEGVVLNSTWLGVPLQHDVNDTLRVMSAKPVDWLVVDHYDIDKQWEAQVRSGFPAVKVLVIDDLADRAHDCDVLVDQTYGRGSQEYQGLVPQDAKFCLGTDFALLRPQFKELKERYAEQEKSRDSICHILVTLGGGDNCQPVQVIGKALKKLAQDQSFSVTVITGNTPEKLLADYKDLTGNVEFIGFSSDVENEMAKADFVIGAGGGTSWERCCMGLPTVVLTIADNQIEIARILNDKRAGISVDTNVDEIASAAKTLLVDHSLRLEMSKNAARLCDGNGVARVIGEMFT